MGPFIAQGYGGIMGRNDNRRSKKMRRLISQRKLKARIKRRAAVSLMNAKAKPAPATAKKAPARKKAEEKTE
jgi:hypothetical protein